MNVSIKQTLRHMAQQMPYRDSGINGFSQTNGHHVIKNGKIKKASLSVFRSKKNKPVDNYRTLKKAYARGGADMVLRTVQHYNQMALK